MGQSTRVHTQRPETLTALVRGLASRQPERIAYTFLVDGEAEELHVDYRGLDARARAVAAGLQRRVAPGDRVTVALPPGPDYVAAFFGCLYAGAVAVPAYPPAGARGAARLVAMAADCGSRAVVTTTRLCDRLRESGATDATAMLAIEDVEVEPADWREPEAAPAQPAYLQYTSGSTRAPRGVVLTHANVMHNLTLIGRAFDVDAEDRAVFWLPPYHDMGLVGGLLTPLYFGVPCVLMSPLAFLQRPARWLRAISRFGSTISGAPDFAYDLCVERIAPEQRARLDLSSWKLAFNGAEPVRAATLRRFGEAFEPHGFRPETFYPCYGLAEATLMVAGGDRRAPPVVRSFDVGELEQGRVVPAAPEGLGRELVGCGQDLPGQRIEIVDPLTLKRSPAERIGEIWVQGPSVARGYWNGGERAGLEFGARLADGGQGAFLRTGDLGFLLDGELFVTGRLRDLIIIRGRNLHPQDLESTAQESHPALRPAGAAAFSIDRDSRERLVVVQEVERRRRSEDLDEALVAIRTAIAEQHRVETWTVALVKAGAVPRAANGKLQRGACRQAFLDGTLPVVRSRVFGASPDVSAAPLGHGRWTAEEVEAEVRRHVAVLLEIEPEEVDLESPVAGLGLGSLRTIALYGEVEDEYGIELPVELFQDENFTLARIIERIVGQSRTPQAGQQE